MTTSAPNTTARNDGINVLRGVAVILVMLRHAWPEVFTGAGIVGVVMFFTLSGNLITGLLIGELQRTGRVRLRRFALRRAARLVPALLVMVAVLAAITLAFDPLGDRDQLLRTVLVALSWTADLPFPHGSAATFHLWTLAVEEQFYLIWPALLLVGWRWRRVGVVLGAVAVVSVLLCAVGLLWAGAHPDLVYIFPTSWWLCFVIGAASRLVGDRVRVPTQVWPVAVLALIVLALLPLRGTALTYLVWAPLVALLTAVLVTVAWRGWGVIRVRPLRALAALGVISYGAYLWDYPLSRWLAGAGWGGHLLAIALALAAASVSWWAVERPISRLMRERSHPEVLRSDTPDGLIAAPTLLRSKA
jgi:peptidoglycan/LPS O-acetylase OafA/YrhL